MKVLIGSALAMVLAAAPASAALTEGARLAGIYDLILDAQFDRADSLIATSCPPAPREACLALQAVSLWWQILQNPNGRLLDRAFERAAETAVDAAEAWTRREPTRAEAWFYLAGAQAPLAQWRVMRGDRLAAARQGARIKRALERALALDATLHDAHFGIGLYHYYADVAPAAARLLRWLLLLPGGDRERGLAEMLKARELGELLRGEADYQLHWIYLWYEADPRRALTLIEGLDAKYPDNPVFLERIAAIHTEYFSDHDAARAAWQTMLERAEGKRTRSGSATAIRARLGLAASLIALNRPQDAIDHLQIVVAAQPAEPFSAHALAELLLGDAYRRAGSRDQARAAYARAIDRAPDDDRLRIERRAREALRQKF